MRNSQKPLLPLAGIKHTVHTTADILRDSSLGQFSIIVDGERRLGALGGRLVGAVEGARGGVEGKPAGHGAAGVGC